MIIRFAKEAQKTLFVQVLEWPGFRSPVVQISTTLATCTVIFVFLCIGRSDSAELTGSFDCVLLPRAPSILDTYSSAHDLLTSELLWGTDLSIDAARGLLHVGQPTKMRFDVGAGYIFLSFGETISAMIDVGTGKVVSAVHD